MSVQLSRVLCSSLQYKCTAHRPVPVPPPGKQQPVSPQPLSRKERNILVTPAGCVVEWFIKIILENNYIDIWKADEPSK